MIKIGDICPLFFSPLKNKFGLDIDYIQKFYVSDKIQVQVFSLPTESPVVKLINLAGGESNISLSVYNQNDTVKMSYATITGKNDGIYIIDVNGKKSEPFEISSSILLLESTTLIKYSNKDNNSSFDNIFWIGNTQITFEWRVEAGFKPSGYNSKVESESYRNQMQELVHLYSVPYDTYTLTVGDACGVPYWYGRHLNRILCLSSISIDEIKYVRSDNSLPELSQVMEESQLFNISVLLEGQIHGISDIGGDSTFSIIVNIDNESIGKCTVDATGDVVSITPSEDGGMYKIVAAKNNTIIIRIVSISGYQVKELTLDGVPLGAMSQYSFENLSSDHTMAVAMEESGDTPVNFLVRSDLANVFYSSMQSALNAVKTDYPDGLTRNVVISCINAAKEKRKSDHYIASLSSWNQRGMFALIIDGKNDLYLDGKSLGCLAFSNVDNIVIRNIHFEDYSNYVGQQIPDAVSAISFTGKVSKYARNLFVGGCTFNGKSMTNEEVMSTNSVILIDTENVTINNSSFVNGCGPIVNANSCNMLSIINNDFEIAPIGVGYPTAVTVSNGKMVIMEDNRMSGDNRYSFVAITNIDKAYIRRNTFRDGGSIALSIASSVPMSKLVIESNLFAGMLSNTSSINTWAQTVIGLCPIQDMELNNNTFYMSGNNGQQYCTRYGSVSHLKMYNNIVVDAKHAANFVYGFAFNDVGELFSDYNIYQYKLHNNVTYGSLIRVYNSEGIEGAVEINADQGCRFAQIQALGYDIHSVLVSDGVEANVLDSNLMITSALDNDNPANNANVPDIDLSYKSKSIVINSRGCYNLHGSIIDETKNLPGYKGYNFETSGVFGNEAQYSSMAEDVLLLISKTLNRNAMPVFSIKGSKDRYLIIGRYGIISPLPIVDEQGEYIEDELYDIDID